MRTTLTGKILLISSVNTYYDSITGEPGKWNVFLVDFKAFRIPLGILYRCVVDSSDHILVIEHVTQNFSVLFPVIQCNNSIGFKFPICNILTFIVKK
jgi:hypothetical protein